MERAPPPPLLLRFEAYINSMVKTSMVRPGWGATSNSGRELTQGCYVLKQKSHLPSPPQASKLLSPQIDQRDEPVILYFIFGSRSPPPPSGQHPEPPPPPSLKVGGSRRLARCHAPPPFVPPPPPLSLGVPCSPQWFCMLQGAFVDNVASSQSHVLRSRPSLIGRTASGVEGFCPVSVAQQPVCNTGSTDRAALGSIVGGQVDQSVVHDVWLDPVKVITASFTPCSIAKRALLPIIMAPTPFPHGIVFQQEQQRTSQQLQLVSSLASTDYNCAAVCSLLLRYARLCTKVDRCALLVVTPGGHEAQVCIGLH